MKIKYDLKLKDWRTHLQNQFEELDLLSKDDFRVYFSLLESRKEMIGHELIEILPDLKRTTIYSILTRLQKQNWIEITNPGKRPALYRALDPLRSVEQALDEHQQHVEQLTQLRDFIINTVLPDIQDSSLFGGRVTRTFILNGIEDFNQQLAKALAQANERIMAHCPLSAISQFKGLLSDAIDRILKKFTTYTPPFVTSASISTPTYEDPDTIKTNWDFQQQYLAITVAREDENGVIDLPVKVAYDSSLLRSQVFVVDSTVFLYLLDAPVSSTGIQLGLGLKMEDVSVANAYAHLLSHIFQEMWIQGLPTPTLEAIDKPMADDLELIEGIERLIQQGWQFLYEDTHPEMPHIGLVAPNPAFSAFRESGILYIPIGENDNPEKVRQDAFNQMAEIFTQEVSKEGQTFDATWFDSTVTILKVECLTRHFIISFPKQFPDNIFSGVDLDYFNPSLPSDPPSCAVFIYYDRAIAAVWAVYPPNVITIMKAILGIEDY